VAGQNPQLKLRKDKKAIPVVLGQLEKILGEIAGEKGKDE